MRIKKIKLLLTMLLFALIVRLFWINCYDGKSLKMSAINQQTSIVEKDNQREFIYDRNMRIIAGNNPRYNKYGLLSHVVGYTWDGGASGLEKAFNDKLLSNNPNIVTAIKDANGKTVKKYYIKGKKSYSGIRLTVDYYIQSIVENAMDNANLTGAVIVVDAKNGGILAMASRPNFKQQNVSEYFNSKNGELINRTICQYNVGSVFKVVTAAAALETCYSDEFEFECKGKSNIDGRIFVCNKSDGHGLISFPQGFAYSCNCLFYSLGSNTGYEQIRKFAYDFGFGEEVLKINGFNEYRGNIPKNVGISNKELANISIGQGEILATPLQVADMMCTIANDGVRKQLMLIGGIVDDNGNYTEIKPSDICRVISANTARSLQQMLKETVMYGTGKGAAIDGTTAAGKTSTAESGWEKDGKTMTHGWFAGYFPFENPKYICVVLAEDGNYGSVSAAPVFKEIGKKILDL